MSASRRRITGIAFVAGVILAAGGGAVAYWTLSGGGTGSATTGTVERRAITVVQTSAVTDLRPGGTAQALSGTVSNSGSSPIFVTSVTVTGVTTDKTNCDETDYTISGPATVGLGVEVAAGGSVPWSGATIAFNDKASDNQDACQGATVTLTYTAN